MRSRTTVKLAFVLVLFCSQSFAIAQRVTEPIEQNTRIHRVSQLSDRPLPIHELASVDRDMAITTPQRPTPSLAAHRDASANDSILPSTTNQMAGPAITVTSSLAVVLGLFALMIWLTRRFGNRSLGQSSLPNEVLQSLGTASLDARTKINLLRCGGRVIVVAQTATGVFPISEFTSPEQVRQLIAACQSTSKQSFEQTLQAFEQEPAPHGFVGREASAADADTDRRKRGRLFATA